MVHSAGPLDTAMGPLFSVILTEYSGVTRAIFDSLTGRISDTHLATLTQTTRKTTNTIRSFCSQKF